MKIVSDFDGVLTEQTEEAESVLSLFRAHWAEIAGDRARVESTLAAGLRDIQASPHRNGWKVRGRISAYADEDLFIRNNALAAWLDERAGAGDAELAADLERLRSHGIAGFMALAQTAFEKMVRESASKPHKPIDPGAKEVFGRLVGAGHEIVVVSNSSTARILDMFKAAGIDARDHADDPRARVRVRGGAAKFELGENAAGFDCGEYFIETSRPRYESILREERPGAVIGDVFSLDLALPRHLARSEPAFPSVALFLRVRDYTPKWAQALAGGSRSDRARMIPIRELSEIPSHL